MNPIEIPVVNLNGSSPERLVEDIRKALEALNDARPKEDPR